MNDSKKDLQTLSLNEMSKLARPTNEEKFLQAVKTFPSLKTPNIDESSLEKEGMSALLRLSAGRESLSVELNAPQISHVFDNTDSDQFDFKPSAKDKFKSVGDGYVPDHLGIAPFARVLSLPIGINTSSVGIQPNYFNNGINVDRLAYPWCCIGKVKCTGYYEFGNIRVPIEKSGTGAMVGRNLMITASHVIPRDATYLRIEFIPAYSIFDPKTPFQSALVIDRRRHTKAKAVTGYDICICRLDRNLGDLTGWMGHVYSDNEDFYYQSSFCSAGYPGAFYNAEEMIAEYNLKVRDIDGDSYHGKEIEFDAFTNRGWSGGPLFAWFKYHPYPLVCGVLSGREKDLFDPTRTVFAGGKRLVDLVNYGHQHWA